MIDFEIWKDISGYEGIYRISNMGRILSFQVDKSGKIRKLNNSKGDYIRVILCKTGIKCSFLLHRLVYESFNGVIPNGMEIDHIDGNKLNNRVSNLQCVSTAMHHRKTQKEHPNLCSGIVKYNTYDKLRIVEQWSLDGNYIAEFPSAKVASVLTGICSRNILLVANKEEYSPGKVRKQAGGFIWKFKE